MNLPGVYYWEPDNFPLSKQAEPFFDLLRKNEILFDNEIDASDKINTIWDRIDEWWFSSNVQNARNNFCNNYARASSNWRQEWIGLINSI